MFIDTRHALLPLTPGHVARLRDACNTRLTCISGAAWVTIDGDRRDIVLSPGESFVVDSNERVVVYPLRAEQLLEVAIDAPTARCRPRRSSGLAGLIARLQGLIMAPRKPGIAIA